MYKALNYWVFGGFTGERSAYEFIDFAAKEKLNGIELTVGDVLKEDITQEECGRILAYADKKNIRIRSLATGFYWSCSLGSSNEIERRRAVEFTLNYLKIGAALHVETILVVPGATRVAWDSSRPVESYLSVWEKSVESLREILPAAEKCGVAIGLENVWNRFLLSPMEWKFYLDQFDSPYLGMYFDVGNCCLFGRPQDYPEILGPRIKGIHLKNFHEDDCAGTLHGFGDDLFSGVVDFKAVFSALDKISYSGPMAAEMVPFCRLPNLVLPDLKLAEKTAAQLRELDGITQFRTR